MAASFGLVGQEGILVVLCLNVFNLTMLYSRNFIKKADASKPLYLSRPGVALGFVKVLP
jgi:hypothetical protein